jgi:hypothetical protein
MLLALVILVFSAQIVIANAAEIDITKISAQWANWVGRDGTNDTFNVNNTNPTGKISIAWGEGIFLGEDPEGVEMYGEQSSYAWTSTATPFKAVENTPFILGEFTHNNFAIYADGNALTQVDLNFTIGDFFNPKEFKTTFTFYHDETGEGDWIDGTWYDNQPDIVTIDSTFYNKEFITEAGGETFYISLLGFSPIAGINDLNFGGWRYTYITQEDAVNKTYLYAVITDYKLPNPFAVPEPTSVVLFFSGLSILGAAAWRKRTKK